MHTHTYTQASHFKLCHRNFQGFTNLTLFILLMPVAVPSYKYFPNSSLGLMGPFFLKVNLSWLVSSVWRRANISFGGLVSGSIEWWCVGHMHFMMFFSYHQLSNQKTMSWQFWGLAFKSCSVISYLSLHFHIAEKWRSPSVIYFCHLLVHKSHLGAILSSLLETALRSTGDFA